MPGKLTIYIGPNGYGKTKKLNAKYESMKSSSIFLKSEILLTNELKLLNNSTSTEYFLDELFNNNNLNNAKIQLLEEGRKSVDSKKEKIKKIVDNILKLNESATKSNLIEFENKLSLKEMFTIDIKILDLMGSGQKMLLLLDLVLDFDKDNIFLDEPEKYMQPNLLKILACKLNNLLKSGKNIFIVTHSPKLLSFLDLKIDNIEIMNEKQKEDEKEWPTKKINLQMAINLLINDKSIKERIIESKEINSKTKSYYNLKLIEKNIINNHKYDFFNALFAKKIIICEGLNDEIFLNWLGNNSKFDDYSIFKTFGKGIMPVFLEIFKQVSKNVICIFDKDNENDNTHKVLNQYLVENSVKNSLIFNKNLESELAYKGEKYDFLNFIYFLENNCDDIKSKYANIVFDKIEGDNETN